MRVRAPCSPLFRARVPRFNAGSSGRSSLSRSLTLGRRLRLEDPLLVPQRLLLLLDLQQQIAAGKVAGPLRCVGVFAWFWGGGGRASAKRRREAAASSLSRRARQTHAVAALCASWCRHGWYVRRTTWWLCGWGRGPFEREEESEDEEEVVAARRFWGRRGRRRGGEAEEEGAHTVSASLSFAEAQNKHKHPRTSL